MRKRIKEWESDGKKKETEKNVKERKRSEREIEGKGKR